MVHKTKKIKTKTHHYMQTKIRNDMDVNVHDILSDFHLDTN